MLYQDRRQKVSPALFENPGLLRNVDPFEALHKD